MSENHLSFKDISLTFDPIQLDKLRNFNIQMFEQISKLNNTYAIIDVSKQVEIISKVFAYRATESMRQSIDGISQTVALWNKTIALQAEKYLLITQSIETNMMESIKQSLINLDYSTYMKSLEKALSSFKIAAADIAYFKKIEVNNPDLNAILPRGFKTLLKDLNVVRNIRTTLYGSVGILIIFRWNNGISNQYAVTFYLLDSFKNIECSANLVEN